MDEQDLAFLGVAGQAELVRTGHLTSTELTEFVLGRIESLNPGLNAFAQILADEALTEAAGRDDHGGDGPLHGVPIAIKDEIDVAGVPTGFGGAAGTRPAPADAEAVRRLRATGAVIVGKTRMPEFGQFPFTESAAHGYTRNPWDLTRTPGGSSGGTAVAVAAGMVAAGTGGDGGGSIRIPSAYCGLYGLKPQRGRVSAAPNRDLWRALGTIGPLTRSVADSALLYDAMRGTVEVDRWSALAPRLSFGEAASSDPGTLRIAVSLRPAQHGIRVDKEIRAAVLATADLLASLGHEVVETDPSYPELAPAFVPQLLGGVRDEAALVDRPDLLERRTKQMLLIGKAFPASAVLWAERRGDAIAARVNHTFDTYDLLVTPTVAELPRPVGQLDGASAPRAALRAMASIAFTAVWNVCGNPAAAVPVGLSRDGLPLSVQLVGRPHDEPTVLQVSAQLEQAQPWANLRPPVR
jgi:amidase